MTFEIPEVVRQLLLFIPVFILCLSFHEFAHAWTAAKFGDPTARLMGRLTMDPMVHISWFGTVIFPAISIAIGSPFLFGWANPVPVDARNFRKPLGHMAIVAAAGPLSNIFLAAVSTAILAVLVHQGIPEQGTARAAAELLEMAVMLNLFLAYFNLLPVPPLDGFRIVQGVVSTPTALKIEGWAQYGQWILILMMLTGMLRVLAIPVLLTKFALYKGLGIPIGLTVF